MSHSFVTRDLKWYSLAAIGPLYLWDDVRATWFSMDKDNMHNSYDNGGRGYICWCLIICGHQTVFTLFGQTVQMRFLDTHYSTPSCLSPLYSPLTPQRQPIQETAHTVYIWDYANLTQRLQGSKVFHPDVCALLDWYKSLLLCLHSAFVFYFMTSYYRHF